MPPDHHDDDTTGAILPAVLAGVPLGPQIGCGGMGRVFRAHHPILDLPVAVKVLHREACDGLRFLAEARLAARVQHERVVRILHAGEEDGWRFLILELVPGGTLKQLVAKRGPLPWREAMVLARQAAEGLAAAHRQGIVHRDVKPSNFLLDEHGRVKLADLGVARSLLHGDAEQCTATGDVVGTVAYMAPEQHLSAHAVTPAADVYALGGTILHLLTGRLPRQVGPIAQLPGIPVALAALLQRLLDADPARRPADGAAVASAIDTLLAEARTGTTTLPARSPATSVETAHSAGSGMATRFIRPRRRWIAAAAAITAVALVGWSMAPGAQPAPAADPPPPAVAPPVADAWQTPVRSVFVLGEGLSAAARAAVDQACAASGLPYIERQRVEALVREQELVQQGRADPATAARLGRLLGGHLALFATPVEDRIELRSVLVETGEIAALRLATADSVAADAAACLATAVHLLPLRTRLVATDGAPAVAAGARHGLRVGDRLGVGQGPDGAPLTVAEVLTVEAGRAQVRLMPETPGLAEALAVRLEP